MQKRSQSIHIAKRLDWAEMTRANSSPRARKVVHAGVENIGFGPEAQLFFDFDPQPGQGKPFCQRKQRPCMA